MSRITPERLAELFDAHADALGLYARQWTDSPADLIQESFLRLASQRKPPERVVPWLYRVVRNAAYEANRREGRRRKNEARASTAESWFAALDDRIDATSASHQLLQLDREIRCVIIARIWGGLTFEEIAEAEGCSLTTAHRRYRSGLEQLLERLEPSWTRPNLDPRST
jgi:RNA polymerase sigma-70 factor (ECF subfamily)